MTCCETTAKSTNCRFLQASVSTCWLPAAAPAQTAQRVPALWLPQVTHGRIHVHVLAPVMPSASAALAAALAAATLAAAASALTVGFALGKIRAKVKLYI